MPAIWNSHFGHIIANKPLLGPAICPTEWGGTATNRAGKADGTWHTAMIDYFIKLGATDQFYWCLNPTSSDTGGLLANDWVTPVQYKLDLLTKLVPLPGRIIVTNGVPTTMSPGGGQATYSLTPGNTVPPTTSSPPVTTTPTTTPPTTSSPPTTTPPPVTDSTFSLTATPVSTWTDANGKLLSQLNYTLTVNNGTEKVSPLLGLKDATKVQQIWNVTQSSQVTNGYTVYTMPSWILQSGGMAPGSNTSFGGIFDVTAGSPVWAINP